MNYEKFISKNFEISERIRLLFNDNLNKKNNLIAHAGGGIDDQIYTNSKDDVKLYFKLIRNNLVHSAKKIIEKKKHTQYFFDELKYYDFDVVVVDEKPKNISELNSNKGFAIWIDKSILYDIKREIYEFTFFTRKDIKSAETKDGKISITNCRYTGNEKWNINKEFYL